MLKWLDLTHRINILTVSVRGILTVYLKDSRF